jgi:hypothetical protein
MIWFAAIAGDAFVPGRLGLWRPATIPPMASLNVFALQLNQDRDNTRLSCGVLAARGAYCTL